LSSRSLFFPAIGAAGSAGFGAGFAGTAGEKNFKIPVFALDFLAKLVQSKTLANRGRNDAEADDDNAALEEEDDEDEPSAALLNDSTLFVSALMLIMGWSSKSVPHKK